MEVEFTKTEEYLIDEVYIVDPSYVIEENMWKTVEEIIFQPKILQSGILEVAGVEFFVFKASEGDGTYTVKKNNKIVDEISCDSGVIAIFHKSEFEKLTGADHNVALEVNFSEKVLVEIEDGKSVGPLGISQDDFLDEEEEYHDEEDHWMND